MQKRIAISIPAVAAAFMAFPLLALVVRRGVNLPFWDEWDWADIVYSSHMHTLTLAELWKPHNEHRIFIPNAIMIALDRVGGWNVVREQVVSVMILALTQLFIWLMIRRTLPRARRGLAFLGASILLFGLAQYENLSWGFQMAWFLCDLGLVGALWALTRPGRRWSDVLIAAGWATLASLSSSQGIVVWVAGLVPIALGGRRALRDASMWVTLGAVVSVLARSGVPSAAQTGGGNLSHVREIVGYVLAYIGTPTVTSPSVFAPILAGTLLVVWFAALLAYALCGPLRLRVVFAPWAAMMIYVVFCGLVTAIGRAGNGVLQATASRYSTIGTLGWIAALVATIALAPMNRRAVTVALALSGLVICASVLKSIDSDWRWRETAKNLRELRVEVAAGDPRALPALYSDPHRVLILMNEMAAVHDGPFTGL